MGITHQKLRVKEVKRLPKPTCPASRHAPVVVVMSRKAKHRERCLQPAQTWLHLGGMETQGSVGWAATGPHSSLPLGRSPVVGLEEPPGSGHSFALTQACDVYLLGRDCHPPRSPRGHSCHKQPLNTSRPAPPGLKGRQRTVFSSGFFFQYW